ncbi:MAG: hypothetical protein V1740_05835 [Candidatus Woesearchaeota archaeon]
MGTRTKTERRPRRSAKKTPKEDEIAGYECVFEEVESGDETTLVLKREYNLEVALSDDIGWEKRVQEAKVGEFFEGLLNFIGTPLEGLETILDKSPTYYQAKRAVNIIKDGRAIPLTRYLLIKGLVDRSELQGRISKDNLERKLLQQGGFDFTNEEYDAMAEFLHGFLKERCLQDGVGCYGLSTVRYGYLGGNSLFPLEWEYFRFFCEINPDFEPFTQGLSRRVEPREDGEDITHITVEPGSKVFYYDMYTGKRRKLRARLVQIQKKLEKAVREKKEFDPRVIIERKYASADIIPELQLLFENYDGKESQHVRVRLKVKKPIKRKNFDAAKHHNEAAQRKRNVTAIVNRAPRYPGYKRYEQYPLCCVNTALNSIFLYSILRFLGNQFVERQIPDAWVFDLGVLTLHSDGVANGFTSQIFKWLDEYRSRSTGMIVKENRVLAKNGQDRISRQASLFDLVEPISHAIAFGEMDSFFDLQPGDYLSFYECLKRTTNALPDKYWELMYKHHSLTHPIPVSIRYNIPINPGETPEQAVARASEQKEQRRREAIETAEEMMRDLRKEFGRVEKRIYPQGHKNVALLWSFLLDPYLITDIQTAETVPIVYNIDHTLVMVHLSVDYKKKFRDTELYTRDHITAVLEELKIPAIMKLVHPNNFIGQS